MAQLWSDILGISLEHIGRESNFFHLGGHSLLSVQLLTKISQKFAHAPLLRELFEQPTLAHVTRRAGSLTNNENSRTFAITATERPPRLPLSYEQRRLWFLEQLNPNSGEYNITSALCLEGDLNVNALEGAVNYVISRHEILRSRVLEDKQGEHLVIDDSACFTLHTEFATLSHEDWKNYCQIRAEQEAATRFDLRVEHLSLIHI